MSLKVLGPAGGREAFDAALAAGADEIYMGLSGYGARRYAANFSPEEYSTALADAHKLGVEISLTLNTIMAESELETVTDDLDRLVESGLDSIIVQDWGVIRFLQRRYPKLPLHASTQMALGNSREVRFAAEYGLSRAVLPRELSFDEIESIRKENPGIELEVFCSGALCLGCSGKCYLSSFVGGRSGNRGSCAQPCRQPYIEKSPESHNEGYLLSLRDQLMGESDIRRLNEIGVDVIKIEGRMKSPSYVFETVNYYRKLTDVVTSGDPVPRGENLDGSRVRRLFNRGYGEGFVQNHNPDILNSNYASHYGFSIGEIQNGKIHLTAPIVNGDGVVYLDSHLRKLDGTNVSLIKIQPKLYGDREKRVPAAGAGETILLDSPPPTGARYLYKTSDFELQKETARLIKQTRRQRQIDLRLIVKVGEPLRLTLSLSPVRKWEKTVLSVTEVSDQILEKSLKQRLDKDSLRKSVDRFGGTSYTIRRAEFIFDPETFLPKSLLNQLRQTAVEKLDAGMAKLMTSRSNTIQIKTNSTVQQFFSTSNAPKVQLSPILYSAAVRTTAQGIAAFNAGITRIYRYPAPVRFEDDLKSSPLEKEFSADLGNLPFSFQPLAGNLAEALFYEEHAVPFTADSSFNVGNVGSALFLLERFSCLTTLFLSNELSRETLLQLGTELAPLFAERNGSIGLAVCGHPVGMYTRKTLFNQRRTEIENHDGRRFTVLRNSDLFSERENSQTLTGSSVFYGPSNDVIDELGRFGNGWEFRADFTTESASEIARFTSRLLKKEAGKKNGTGYGFDHPIF